jgi:hypothetical protein
MYARVTLLEIDTSRTSVDDVLWEFEMETVERLRSRPGYRGVWAMSSPDGKGLMMTLWDTEAQASAGGVHELTSQAIAGHTTVLGSPAGREMYEVMYIDEAAPEPR